MNNKQTWAVFVFVAALFQSSAIYSQAVDPTTLAAVRDYVSQVRHPDQVDILAHVRVMVPTNPEAYIMALADQPTTVPGLRLRAFGLLGGFENNAAVRTFLEARLSNRSLNEAYRQVAITSFVRANYERDPAGVERVLARVTSDNSRVVRGHAVRILENARKGQKHPAGKQPKGRGSR